MTDPSLFGYYDCERRTAFIVHREEFGVPNMVFDMHPCRLHVYYPKKIDGQYGFVQTVADNMKLFTKRQIQGVLKACHLYETLGYPSNADFETVLRAAGMGSCTLTADDAKVAYKIGAILSLGLRVVLSETQVNTSLRAW